MTCTVCSVSLQLCPGASACDNYTVLCPGLVLLKKCQRLIQHAVFLEFKLPFCPNAHYPGDDGCDQQLVGEIICSKCHLKKMKRKEKKRKRIRFLEQKFLLSEPQTDRCIALALQYVVWIN